MHTLSVYAPYLYVIHYLNCSPDLAVRKAFRQSVEELLKKAEVLGFNLAIENVPYKKENQRYPTTNKVVQFVRSFHSQSLSICVDVNHSNVAENLEEVVRTCVGLISNIHISDNHGKKEEHLLPGQVTIDLPGTLVSLINAGYSGPLNLECHLPAYPSLQELVLVR